MLNLYDWNNLPEEVLFKNILFNGHPNEQESDKCISELLNQGNIKKFHRCNQTDNCKKIMLTIDDSNGYPLTHKLSVYYVIKINQYIKIKFWFLDYYIGKWPKLGNVL